MEHKVIRLNNDYTNQRNLQIQHQVQGTSSPKRKHLGLILIFTIVLFSLASVSLVHSYQHLQKQVGLEQKAKAKNADLKAATANNKAEVKKLQDPDFILKYARQKYNYSLPGEMIFNTPGSTTGNQGQ